MNSTRFLKTGFLAGLLMSIFWFSSCATPPVRTIVPSSALLPHVTRQMQTPGFWISRHPSPDEPFLDIRQIDGFNRHIQQNLKATVNILDENALRSGQALKTDLEKDLFKLAHKPVFRDTGQVMAEDYLDQMRNQMYLSGIAEYIPVQYGIVIRFANQRILPTDDPLYSEPGDIDFDELQNSALDMGTPVRILHETPDRLWCYAQSELSGGWVRTDAVGRCDRNDAQNYFRPNRFVVAIRAKSDIYTDSGQTAYHETIRMGTCLPLLMRSDLSVAIRIPLRNPDGSLRDKTGYIQASAVHEGFLEATPRKIFHQAFELLNAPYGWGGMYGEQDCSRFIQEIFATTGIRMPRNSSDQAKAGRQIAVFSETAGVAERYESLDPHATGGSTLLYLKGHVMLYLGQSDNRHYVIHSTYSYRKPSETTDSTDTTVQVNRVAVSDLSMGQGSKRGSLAERLVSARKISTGW